MWKSYLSPSLAVRQISWSQNFNKAQGQNLGEKWENWRTSHPRSILISSPSDFAGLQMSPVHKQFFNSSFDKGVSKFIKVYCLCHTFLYLSLSFVSEHLLFCSSFYCKKSIFIFLTSSFYLEIYFYTLHNLHHLCSSRPKASEHFWRLFQNGINISHTAVYDQQTSLKWNSYSPTPDVFRSNQSEKLSKILYNNVITEWLNLISG